MDFGNVNSFNIKLNKFSGNLLPVTSDSTVFSMGWKIYSAVMTIFLIIQISAMMPGLVLVPKIKALQDSTVTVVVNLEVFFMLIQLHIHKDFLRQLIRRLNKILHVEDEIMRSVTRSTMKTVKTPLKVYCISGNVTILAWYCASFLCIFKRKQFFYEDYRIPAVYSKQPFSIDIFLVGNVFAYISSMNIFTKKSALDAYMINILLLMTAQYRYIAKKLAIVMQGEIPQNWHQGKYQPNVESWTEMEIRALCRHQSVVIQMTPILKKLLSLNFSLLYLTSVFRFCFVGVMLMCATTPMEAAMVISYLCGALMQFYMLCLCVHQLWEASIETTDKAFHAKWYEFGSSVKSMFLLMMIGNNLECKLSALEKCNLSLPSLMTVLNQAYSIGLLIMRMK